MSKSLTRNIIKQRTSAAVNAIQSAVRFIDGLDEDNPKYHPHIVALSAEIQLLATIAIDWESGFYNTDYPAELPIVAAIRGNLGLTTAASSK